MRPSAATLPLPQAVGQPPGGLESGGWHRGTILISSNTPRTAMVVIGVLIGAVCVICQSSEEVPFPQQYRKWWHVKTTVIGPQNTNFKRNGGIHQ